MKLTQLAKMVNGQLMGDDVLFSDISIDTRTLQPESLYIAIVGDRFDGHAFVDEAIKKGASAVLVSKKIASAIPQIIVDDTRKALGLIAKAHRDAMNIPVVGITGSCGKTTTRAIMESVLSQNGKVLASKRSYNNDIGVPLTLLQLDASDDYAVIEMGANHHGEIAQLSEMVGQDVAILTCAAEAHLEGFGSLEGVSTAKGEIFQALSDTGKAVINADDQFADYWKTLVNNDQIITFGLDEKADVRAVNINYDLQGCPTFTLKTPVGDIDVQLPLMGLHNVRNAAAATAAAIALDLPLDKIKHGLEQAAPVSGRLVLQRGVQGVTVIDDSYNANPGSVAAAIDLLVNRGGESVLVLGDMMEMGENAEQIHFLLGELAREKGLKHLYCYGPLSKQTVQAFGGDAKHFDDQLTLINSLKAGLTQSMTVLVKGSNSMGMKKVVDALVV